MSRVTPKRLLVVSDHSNSRVERSRSQVPTPNPSILSLKCSLPAASADDDRVMLVTPEPSLHVSSTSMYPASRREPETGVHRARRSYTRLRSGKCRDLKPRCLTCNVAECPWRRKFLPVSPRCFLDVWPFS